MLRLCLLQEAMFTYSQLGAETISGSWAANGTGTTRQVARAGARGLGNTRQVPERLTGKRVAAHKAILRLRCKFLPNKALRPACLRFAEAAR